MAIIKPLFMFTRPHTMVGTLVSVPAVCYNAGASHSAVLNALVPALLTNVFVVGVNQLTDVGVDIINKPGLPLASGELTPRMARRVTTMCILGAVLTSLSSPWLLATTVTSALVGLAYSCEPLRLKRSAVAAMACIVFVRGFVVNVGFARYSGGCTNWRTVRFFSAFACLISLLKDVPDTAGDEANNLPSFALTTSRAAVLTTVKITVTFVGALVAASATSRVRRVVAINAVGTWIVMSLLTKPNDDDKVRQLYMLLWSLFYLSYLTI